MQFNKSSHGQKKKTSKVPLMFISCHPHIPSPANERKEELVERIWKNNTKWLMRCLLFKITEDIDLPKVCTNPDW